MTLACKYVALFVPDLRAAENFYCDAFGLGVLFRESEQDGGTWCTLRPDVAWEEAEEAGVRVGMTALGSGLFVLALFRGTPQAGTLLEICFGVPPAEIEAIRARIGDRASVLESRPGWLRFEDPFGFRWAVQPSDATFRSSGEIAGRWAP